MIEYKIKFSVLDRHFICDVRAKSKKEAEKIVIDNVVRKHIKFIQVEPKDGFSQFLDILNIFK